MVDYYSVNGKIYAKIRVKGLENIIIKISNDRRWNMTFDTHVRLVDDDKVFSDYLGSTGEIQFRFWTKDMGKISTFRNFLPRNIPFNNGICLYKGLTKSRTADIRYNETYKISALYSAIQNSDWITIRYIIADIIQTRKALYCGISTFKTYKTIPKKDYNECDMTEYKEYILDPEKLEFDGMEDILWISNPLNILR